MAQQTLQAMDDRMFLAKVDVLLEALERQTEGDPLGDWTVQSIKEEVRRRLLVGRQAVAERPPPVTVEVERLRFAAMTIAHSYAGDFRGTLSRVTVRKGSAAVSHGFFTGAEADAFLLGLETARKFGFPFTYIPDADGDAV